MNIRESLPARVALATTGLLALILLVVTASAYAITALVLRDGLDYALQSTITSVAGGDRDLFDRAKRFEEDDHDHRRLQILDNTGQVQFGPAGLPVDPLAVARAQRDGFMYVSVVEHDDRWRTRLEPDWWQALTPREGEMRVLYARGGSEDAPVVLQMAAPLGAAGTVLPALLKGMLLLAVLACVAAFFASWWMASQTYRPLQAIIATAEDVSTRTLSVRLADVWRDRTLRELIRVLNAMMGRLQESFEAQGRFVAAAAHELRGPLAAMRAELEVALRRERSGEEYRAALEGALSDTARLSSLSEHLLVLARYERGSAFAMERDLPLTALLERTADEVRRSAGGEVAVAAEPGLLVDGDSLALERAVSNLARNAVQAGGSPVTVEAAPGDGGVWLHVRDRGPGIPREALPHIFEPFYRADPARGRDGGTGLGLAIVKTIVEAHCGRIAVESAPGQGTVFHLWFPRRQREQEGAQPS